MSEINPAALEQREIRIFVTHCPASVRAAIYAVILSRSLPVMDQFFDGDLGLREIQELLWANAAGKDPALSRADELRTHLEDVIGRLYDADEQGYPMAAAKALSAALCDLAPREWDVPEDCPFYVIELADCVQRGVGILEEARWQSNFIRQVGQLGVIDRATLETLNVRAEWTNEFCRRHPTRMRFQ